MAAELAVEVRVVKRFGADVVALDGLDLGIATGETSGGSLALPEVTPARAAAINRELVDAGLEVSEVMTDRRPLREVFPELTGRRPGGSWRGHRGEDPPAGS